MPLIAMVNSSARPSFVLTAILQFYFVTIELNVHLPEF